jgi:hypothetical protein
MKAKTMQQRGRGRPPIKEGQGTHPTTIRLTDDQYAEYIKLGGADWIRAMLNLYLLKK